MAVYGENIPHTIPSAADASTWQYRAIVIDTNGRGTLAGSAGAAIGILMNKPSGSNLPMRYVDVGEAKMVAGNAWNEGDYLQSNAQGFGTTAAGVGDRVIARAMQAVGGSGDIGIVQVLHFRNAS